jgi:hypothetical protein
VDPASGGRAVGMPICGVHDASPGCEIRVLDPLRYGCVATLLFAHWNGQRLCCDTKPQATGTHQSGRARTATEV